MRLWIRARRRKISERPFADSGRFPDAVPKSSGRWPRKKVHRNPAAGAGAGRSVLLSRSVEDQNPLRFFCEGLALINSEMGLGRTFRAKTLGSAGCQPALVGSSPTRFVFGRLPNTAGKLPALPGRDQRARCPFAPRPRPAATAGSQELAPPSVLARDHIRIRNRGISSRSMSSLEGGALCDAKE